VVEGVAGEGAGRCGPGGAASDVDCTEAVHQLYHYLDGELTDERRREIAVHLDACASCGSAAEFEAELRAVIANRCRDRVPESLLARIAGAIHEEARHQRGAP
jgi:mycothiol system anti-sigma-R factor